MANSQITPPAGDRQHVPTDQAAPELLARRLLEDRIAAVEEDMAADAQDAEETGEQLDSCDYDVVMPYETAQTILAALPLSDLAAPSAQQAQDHRSFPDAADGRPMPPMGDELMIAGLNSDEARFVANQLAQNGLTLVPSAPAEVEGLVERLHRSANMCPTKDDAIMREAAATLTALQAENERLREALTEISNAYTAHGYSDAMNAVQHLKDTAKEAIND